MKSRNVGIASGQDRDRLLIFPTLHYQRWPEHRREALYRELDEALENWRKSNPGEAKKAPPSRLDLLMHLYSRPDGEAVTSLAAWYGLDWIIAVLTVDNASEMSLTDLIVANNYLHLAVSFDFNDQLVQLNGAKAELAKLKRPRRTAQTVEHRKKIGEGKTKAAYARDKVIRALALEMMQAYSGMAPDDVAEKVCARLKTRANFPKHASTYRRKIAGMFRSKKRP